MNNKQYFVELIMEAVQGLEEIGGPDTPEEYIEVLEAVKVKINERIENAKSLVGKEE